MNVAWLYLRGIVKKIQKNTCQNNTYSIQLSCKKIKRMERRHKMRKNEINRTCMAVRERERERARE